MRVSELSEQAVAIALQSDSVEGLVQGSEFRLAFGRDIDCVNKTVVRCPSLIILFSDLAVNAFLLQQLADGLVEVNIQPRLLPKCIESGCGIALIAIVPDELADDGPVSLLCVRLIAFAVWA